MRKTILTASILAIAFSGCFKSQNNITVNSNLKEFKGTYKQINPIMMTGKHTMMFKDNNETFKGTCSVTVLPNSTRNNMNLGGLCFVKSDKTSLTCNIKNSKDTGLIIDGKCKDKNNKEYVIMGD